MGLSTFLAVVALGASVALLLRQADRPLAIGAVVLSAAEAAMAFGWVTIRVASASFIGWLALAVVGVLLFLKQNTRTGGALGTAIVIAAAIPILMWLRIVRG